ncbi:hypothetical protein FGB62_257g05 [Gracilaria domingensis]|nr:hypothetical protein FGB62_257g05 [Gracilaria domingensis]
MKREARRPAMIAAPPVAPAAPLLPGALLLASLVASARPLQIKLPNLPNLPELPKFPKLPDLDLPNFGKKKTGESKKPAARAPRSGTVKVRAAAGVVPTDAPTLAELKGDAAADSIPVGAGWKRFPERRMPGANMDGWKEIAKQLTPKN